MISDLYCLLYFFPASDCWDHVCFLCANKELPLIAADRSPNQLFLPVWSFTSNSLGNCSSFSCMKGNGGGLVLRRHSSAEVCTHRSQPACLIHSLLSHSVLLNPSQAIFVCVGKKENIKLLFSRFIQAGERQPKIWAFGSLQTALWVSVY